MRRRDLLVLLPAAAVAVALPSWAQNSDPKAPIAALNETLIAIMKAGSQQAPFVQRAQMLKPAVERAFNLHQILESSVGLRWHSIPPATQHQLLAVFTDYTVDSYVANFDSYNGQRLDVLPETRTVANDTIVRTQIVSTSGDTTNIDYVMRNGAAGWQAVDVLFDRISRVATQRSDFRGLIGTDGSLLLSLLRKKVTDLQSGNAG